MTYRIYLTKQVFIRYMEQNNVIATSQKPSNQSEKQAKKASAETFAVKDSAGIETLFATDYSDFPAVLGQLLNKVQAKATFSLLGKVFVIPSLTASNSNPERAAAIFKQMVTHFFPAEKDVTEAIKSDTKEGKMLNSLKDCGFKFSSLNKVQVLEAVNVWLKNKRAKKTAQKIIVHKLNSTMIAQTKVLNEFNKDARIALGAELVGYEKVYRIEAGKLLKA